MSKNKNVNQSLDSALEPNPLDPELVRQLGLDDGKLFLCQSMKESEAIIDEICARGGKHLYDQYLQPKIKPYSIAKESMQLSNLGQQEQIPGDLGEVEFVGFSKKRFGSVAQVDFSKDKSFRELQGFPHEAWIDGGEPEAGKIENHNPHNLKIIKRGDRLRSSKNTDTELPNATQQDDENQGTGSVPRIHSRGGSIPEDLFPDTASVVLSNKGTKGGPAAKRYKSGKIRGQSVRGSYDQRQKDSTEDPVIVSGSAQIKDTKSPKAMKKGLKAVFKGKINEIKKRDSGLGIPIELTSPSVVDRFKDTGPEAKLVEELRRMKEIQERNLQRKEAHLGRRTKPVGKLMSNQNITDLSKDNQSINADLPIKKRQDNLESKSVDTRGGMFGRAGRNSDAGGFTTDYEGKIMQVKKPGPNILQAMLGNQVRGPNFEIQTGAVMPKQLDTDINLPSNDYMQRSMANSSMPNNTMAGTAFESAAPGALSQTQQTGKSKTSKSVKDKKASVAMTRQQRQAYEIKKAQDDLNRKYKELLAENQVNDFSSIGIDLDQVGHGVVYRRPDTKGRGGAYKSGGPYNLAHQGRMSKAEFKQKRAQQHLENQVKLLYGKDLNFMDKLQGAFLGVGQKANMLSGLSQGKSSGSNIQVKETNLSNNKSMKDNQKLQPATRDKIIKERGADALLLDEGIPLGSKTQAPNSLLAALSLGGGNRNAAFSSQTSGARGSLLQSGGSPRRGILSSVKSKQLGSIRESRGVLDFSQANELELAESGLPRSAVPCKDFKNALPRGFTPSQQPTSYTRDGAQSSAVKGGIFSAGHSRQASAARPSRNKRPQTAGVTRGARRVGKNLANTSAAQINFSQPQIAIETKAGRNNKNRFIFSQGGIGSSQGYLVGSPQNRESGDYTSFGENRLSAMGHKLRVQSSQQFGSQFASGVINN